MLGKELYQLGNTFSSFKSRVCFAKPAMIESSGIGQGYI